MENEGKSLTTVRFYSEKSQTLLKSPMTSQRALTWTLTASWNTLKKLQGAIRKSHFPAINQHIPYSLCSHMKSAYSTCHLTNRHLCCLATSCLLEQGVNSGNRITQHVKNELGTTVHVRRNYSAYPWILVLNGWLEGIFFFMMNSLRAVWLGEQYCILEIFPRVVLMFVLAVLTLRTAIKAVQ